MNTAWVVLIGAALLAVFGASLLLLIRNLFVVAIPLACGGALLCLVPIFFAKSVAPIHQAFDEFMGQPHQPAPFEDVSSVTEAWERMKLVVGSLQMPMLPSGPEMKPQHMLARVDLTQIASWLLFLFVFLTLFSFYKLFRLMMAYAGCGVPWGRRARVEVGGMEYKFKLNYPYLIAGGVTYDLSESVRDEEDPYLYYLPSGTILRFYKLSRRSSL
jgi:hypothetical protein